MSRVLEGGGSRGEGRGEGGGAEGRGGERGGGSGGEGRGEGRGREVGGWAVSITQVKNVATPIIPGCARRQSRIDSSSVSVLQSHLMPTQPLK